MKPTILSTAIVLIIIALTGLRYISTSSSGNIRNYSQTDFTHKLHPAQLILIGEKLNINTASEEGFEVLYRVGPVLAKRIVEDREANGPFRSIDDLKRVPGIGPTIINKNRHCLLAP